MLSQRVGIRAMVAVVVFFGCSGQATEDAAEAGAGGSGQGGTDPGEAPSTNVGGTSESSAGGPGSPGGLVLGEELELVPGEGVVPYAIGSNPHGIRGTAYLLRSELGNDVTVASTPGELCIRGVVEDIEALDYARYWGIEVGFDLSASSSAGDGIDGVDPVPEPWSPGRVIGFSYVIEGPQISPIRFESLPAGYDPEADTSVFCKDLEITSGAAESTLFGDVTQGCWEAGQAPLPVAGGLVRIGWQLAADVEPVDRRFDWCLKQLRPILAAP